MAKTPFCTTCGKRRPNEEGPNDTRECTPCLIQRTVTELTKETCTWLDAVISPDIEQYSKMRATFIIGRAYRRLCRIGLRNYLHEVDLEKIVKGVLAVLDA